MKKPLCLALALLLLCALLAACTPADSSSSSSAPSLSAASSLPASSQSEPASPVATLVYGGKTISLGMTKPQVDAALSESGREAENSFGLPDTTTFFYLADQEGKGLTLVFAEGSVVLASFNRGEITAFKGLSVGSSAADFRAAYPDAADPTEVWQYSVFFKEETVVHAGEDVSPEDIEHLDADFFTVYLFDDAGAVESISVTASVYSQPTLLSVT